MYVPKVLISCPITELKDYCLPEWLSAVLSIDYDNSHVYFVDNSKDRGHAEDIRALGIECDYHEPSYSPRIFVTECQNKIRQKVLDEGYDYLFMLECDQFPPKDIIHKLLAHNKQVVGAHYYIFSGTNMKNIMADAFYEPLHHMTIRHLSVMQGFEYMGSGVKKTMHLGLGCILIHRSVLEKIEFRVVEGEAMASDSYFHEDLYRNRIPCYVDTDIITDHYSDGWGVDQSKAKKSLMI